MKISKGLTFQDETKSKGLSPKGETNSKDLTFQDKKTSRFAFQEGVLGKLLTK